MKTVFGILLLFQISAGFQYNLSSIPKFADEILDTKGCCKANVYVTEEKFEHNSGCFDENTKCVAGIVRISVDCNRGKAAKFHLKKLNRLEKIVGALFIYDFSGCNYSLLPNLAVILENPNLYELFYGSMIVDRSILLFYFQKDNSNQTFPLQSLEHIILTSKNDCEPRWVPRSFIFSNKDSKTTKLCQEIRAQLRYTLTTSADDEVEGLCPCYTPTPNITRGGIKTQQNDQKQDPHKHEDTSSEKKTATSSWLFYIFLIILSISIIANILLFLLWRSNWAKKKRDSSAENAEASFDMDTVHKKNIYFALAKSIDCHIRYKKHFRTMITNMRTIQILVSYLAKKSIISEKNAKWWKTFSAEMDKADNEYESFVKILESCTTRFSAIQILYLQSVDEVVSLEDDMKQLDRPQKIISELLADYRNHL